MMKPKGKKLTKKQAHQILSENNGVNALLSSRIGLSVYNVDGGYLVLQLDGEGVLWEKLSLDQLFGQINEPRSLIPELPHGFLGSIQDQGLFLEKVLGLQSNALDFTMKSLACLTSQVIVRQLRRTVYWPLVAYIGETIRREYPLSSWALRDAVDSRVPVVVNPNGNEFCPTEMVFDLLFKIEKFACVADYIDTYNRISCIRL